MGEVEIGLVSKGGEVTYREYERKVVRFKDGALAEPVQFPEVPKGSIRQTITHVRVFHPDGSTADVPLSVALTIGEDIIPVLSYIDWSVIHEWSDESMTIRNKLIEGDPLDPSSGDVIVQFANLAVGHPVPEGWRVLSGNIHTSQIARVVLRYEIEPEGEN